jgi:two-component system OmpR family response regulator
MATVLLVDDDPHLLEVLQLALEAAGFATRTARHGLEALRVVAQQAPDVIVLDVQMPELDGTEVCRRLRAQGSAIPILFLSSRAEEIDRVLGLELGGDDYLAKPFSTRELVARVRALLRRARPGPVQPRRLLHGRLALDLDRHAVEWDGARATLTPAECGVLRTLLRQPGRVFSRDALMDGTYDIHKVVSERTVDSHVRRVRARLAALGAPEVIETLHGVGYRLGPCE